MLCLPVKACHYSLVVLDHSSAHSRNSPDDLPIMMDPVRVEKGVEAV